MIFVLGFICFVLGGAVAAANEHKHNTAFSIGVGVWFTGILAMVISLLILAWRFLP